MRFLNISFLFKGIRCLMKFEEQGMYNKNVMITGANSGIGKETAIALAKKGAFIIMLCRNQEKAEKAMIEIKERANTELIDLIIADLSDQKRIYSAVEEFKAKYDHLDVLINNAGSILRERHETEEGYEMTFAANHLGHFLLTLLLLDVLIRSAPSRIINVSSEAHRFASLDFDNINLIDKFSPFRAYSNSKLANMLFSYEIARRLESTGVTVNALHPGVVKSNFGRGQYNKFITPFIAFSSLFMINSKKGAKTSIYLASSDEVKDVSRKYFKKQKAVKSSKASYNKETQKELWELSLSMVKQQESFLSNSALLKL